MTFSSYRIRKSEKNLKLLRSLDEICFPEDDFPLFAMPYNMWWIVYNDGSPIAYCGARVRSRYLELIRAGVIPEYRGNKIHEILLNTRLSYAKKKKKQALITHVSYDNKPSLNNLLKFGFKEWSPNRRYLCKGFMNLKLDFYKEPL